MTSKTKTLIHLATAAVGGPALIWAGFSYAQSAKAKAFFIATGAALLVTHYSYFDQDARKLLAPPPEPESKP